MMYSLSKDEAKKLEATIGTEMDAWWSNLSYRERRKVYDQYKVLFKQINCDHEWKNSKFYDEPIKVCPQCDLTKKIDENNFFVIISDIAPSGWWYSEKKGEKFNVKKCASRGELLDTEGISHFEIEDIFIVIDGEFKSSAIIKTQCKID